MKGSLTQKHGKYYVVVRLLDANGEFKTKWINTGVPTAGNHKREANKKKLEILNSLEEQKVVYTCNTLFVDWFDTWFAQKEQTVRVNTYEGYKYYANKH